MIAIKIKKFVQKRKKLIGTLTQLVVLNTIKEPDIIINLLDLMKNFYRLYS